MPSRHRRRSVGSAARGSSPTMKRCAMWRTPAAPAAPSAARPAFVLPIRIAARSDGGLLADLVEEARQVRREIVERAAGGDDVDEAKQRGAQLVVLGREVHRAVVERLERVAAVRRKRVVQCAPDAPDLALRASRARPRGGRPCATGWSSRRRGEIGHARRCPPPAGSARRPSRRCRHRSASRRPRPCRAAGGGGVTGVLALTAGLAGRGAAAGGGAAAAGARSRVARSVRVAFCFFGIRGVALAAGARLRGLDRIGAGVLGAGHGDDLGLGLGRHRDGAETLGLDAGSLPPNTPET